MYTYSKSAFQLGPGYTNILATEVNAELAMTIKGINLYEVLLPDRPRRVLSPSGAIVGGSLWGVVRDLESADMEIVKQQLEKSKETVKKAKPVSNEEFYKIYLK
jgi:hypothetical protein